MVRGTPSYTIMGVDPGLHFTGFAVATVRGRSNAIERVCAIGLMERGVTRSLPKSEDRFQRAGLLSSQRQWVVTEFNVDAIACEMPFLSAHRYGNFAAGMMVGVVSALNLPTPLVWPRQVKAAVSHGIATKREVIAWAMRTTEPDGVPWPTSVVPNGLGLTFGGKQIAAYAEHPADALAAIQAGIETDEWLTAPDRE